MKVGVIGYGYWGPKLVRNLTEMPDCEMAWVADRSEAALERVRATGRKLCPDETGR